MDGDGSNSNANYLSKNKIGEAYLCGGRGLHRRAFLCFLARVKMRL